GKRVVRVAVEASVSKGTRVLGEERVIYDDWIKGFSGVAGTKADEAIAKLVAVVEDLSASGAETGLNAVKDRMKRNDPTFEEEDLGIPTFRHLAYLAEARGLIRIDATTEPALAYGAEVEKTANGTPLLPGAAWTEFISKLDPAIDYNRSGLEATFESSTLAPNTGELKKIVTLALKSDVLVGVSGRYMTRDNASQRPAVVPNMKYRLNSHHPRVQVALATP
ncbi:MAG: hypothetical protein KDA58_13420, partial [Planctomycetaceae bacterium]|nr:hypothetical protein [Planctomycetaceae bacterium]